MLIVVIALAGAMSGCGTNSGALTLARVSGTVTYKGQPVKNATVVFLPDQQGVRLASGRTDDKGRFELMTEVPGDGVVLGKHRVSITAREPDPALTQEQQSTLLLSGQGVPQGKPLIPVKYFNFETSGLAAEVKSGANTSNFDLKE
jgi:hypothetical protein